MESPSTLIIAPFLVLLESWNTRSSSGVCGPTDLDEDQDQDDEDEEPGA